MHTDHAEIELLLSGIAAERAARCARSSHSPDCPIPEDAVLARSPVSWVTHLDRRRTERAGPRHQTLRFRGKPALYPRPIDLTRGTPGTLIMGPHGLSLEPADPELSGSRIEAGTIRQAQFYADCIELLHGDRQRTLIVCDGIESFDLLFEAHYSNAALLAA